MGGMKNGRVAILWDASYIWGLMAWRAARALELPCRLVMGHEITQGLALGKGDDLLLAPGGSARLKAAALGPRGLEAIRAWLRSGGSYLGFCGGAGFALRQERPDYGLEICPLARRAYAGRETHFMSGNVVARVSGKGLLALPVWWPGRFDRESRRDSVEIHATYEGPGDGFLLGDKPWDSARNRADFPFAEPLVVTGAYEDGVYALSYAHLETPASPEANDFLIDILRDYFDLNASRVMIPEWFVIRGEPVIEDDEISVAAGNYLKRLRALFELAENAGLFAARTPWLPRWRAGEPGMACANLLAGLEVLTRARKKPPALRFWREKGAILKGRAENFFERAEKYFYARLLLKEGAERADLASERDDLFGRPMPGGGAIQSLIDAVYRLIYLCQPEN